MLTKMIKSAWLLCLLVLLGSMPLMAQAKMEKKQKKAFLEAVVPACVSFLSGNSAYAGMVKAVNMQGYCACMMEDLTKQYTMEQLLELFANPNNSTTALAIFENEANLGKSMLCMKSNVQDEAALKSLLLQDSFGQEACVGSMQDNGLADQINSEGYCSCMFEKMSTQFSLNELLTEATYEGDKFRVIAMECVLANTR